MNAACANNVSMKRQIHIALAQLSALARITPKTGPNAKQLAFGFIEKKSRIDYSYIEKHFCVFGNWGNSSLRQPQYNCFRLVSESILREQRSQFRRCNKVSATCRSFARRQHQAAKSATYANGRTTSPNCPWPISRIVCIAVWSYPLGSEKRLGSRGWIRRSFKIGCRPQDA